MILSIPLLFIAFSSMAQKPQHTFTAAWWNVENLFDTRDDPRTNDEEFTPKGEYHWTARKLWDKLHGIYKTILMMELPDVIGLAEVENNYVLRNLCEGTPLAHVPYRYVHYDSPDPRGIDVALLYRTDRFIVDSSRRINLSDSIIHYFTRDMLLVRGHTPAGDTLSLLLNHWPSKRGGDEAENHRIKAARKLRSLMVEEFQHHPGTTVIAMGDMNSTLNEAPIAEGMDFGTDSINPDGIRLLTRRLPKDWGSHKYQGDWRYIDQMMLLANDDWMVGELKLIRFEHLLIEETSRPGMRPKRTNLGPRYEGGLSDHLPLLLRLKKRSDTD